MLKVFLSHSSRDADLAAALVELIRFSLGLSGGEIRCTSVAGYGLRAGASVERQLRQEIFEAEVLVALVSRESLHSSYVLFELGARWAAEKPLVPLLASGIDLSSLTPPLSALSALRCDDRADLHQFISDLANYLNSPVDNAAPHERYIQKILDAAGEPLSITRPRQDDTVTRRPIVEGSVRDLNSEVWVVVHPLGSAGFWVQPKPAIKRDGSWKTQVFVGREGQDFGSYYEICAVANPKAGLKEGDVLEDWPPAAYQTDVIEVLRV